MEQANKEQFFWVEGITDKLFAVAPPDTCPNVYCKEYNDSYAEFTLSGATELISEKGLKIPVSMYMCEDCGTPVHVPILIDTEMLQEKGVKFDNPLDLLNFPLPTNDEKDDESES